ncbi:MAG: methylmalonyl-CoA epimerase [Bacteroidetes bacterium]|nr:methylmalonyl-CoA epimerase [Bacteroidota bacterium]
MGITHIEHIGIAVKNLEVSIRLYESLLGTDCCKIEDVPDQKVRTAFFQVGPTKIELLESDDPEGPVSKFIERKGEGVHHIAVAVENLADTLKEIEVKGFEIIDKKPRRGAEGSNIVFLHPKSTCGVLLELCECSASKK